MKKKLMSFVIAAGVLLSTGELVHASTGDDIINTGDNYLGKPYRYGSIYGNTSSFDCSSFTSYVFAKNGITLPRTSAGQAKVGTPVSKANLEKGDLLFYDTNYDGVINHVAIYAGNGKILHAATSYGISFVDAFSKYYWGARYVTARRVIKEEAPVASIASTSNVQMIGKASTHKVQKGETLWSISKKYKTTVANLRKWNGLKSDALKIGQTLKLSQPVIAKQTVKKAVPVKKAAAAKATVKTATVKKASVTTKTAVKKVSVSAVKTYTVKKGDSLWAISKSKHTTVNKLVAANHLQSTKLSPGQKLKITK